MSAQATNGHVGDRLPWYVAGRLDADEEAAIARHLAACPECRALAATADLAREGSTMATPAELLAHVHAQLLEEYVRDPDRLEAETRLFVRGHLATCETCRDAVSALAAVERELAAAGDEDLRSGMPAHSLPTIWRGAAIGAAAATVVAAVGWIWALVHAPASAPAVNVAVATLAPSDLTLRGDAPSPTRIELPAEAEQLTLVLVSERREPVDAREVEIGRDNEAPLWTLPGVERLENGLYTVRLPARALTPGLWTLRIVGRRAESGERIELESYRMRLERGNS